MQVTYLTTRATIFFFKAASGACSVEGGFLTGFVSKLDEWSGLPLVSGWGGGRDLTGGYRLDVHRANAGDDTPVFGFAF